MLQSIPMLRLFALQIFVCSLCAAYPYIVVPSSSGISKRAFDRVEQGSFGFEKRAFDRLEGGGDFGLMKRSIDKRAFDRLELADFGLRRKRAFDRIARSEFGLRRKRSFDRLGGTEFGLMKRSGQMEDREALVHELASSIAALRRARETEPVLVLEEEEEQQQ